MIIQRHKRLAAIAVSAIAVAVLVYLGLNDPTVAPAPRCAFKGLTGLDCPGCGAQRAAHALMHGRLAEAWGYNAALFFLVLLAGAYLLGPRSWDRVLYHPRFMRAVALAVVAWWIGRNFF